MRKLTFEDRAVIDRLYNSRKTFIEIGQVIGISQSGVGAEVRRNSIDKVYDCRKAQELCELRFKEKNLRTSKVMKGHRPPHSEIYKQLKTLEKDVVEIKKNQAANCRLTSIERTVIARLIGEGKSCNSIAKLIGRGKNAIVTEIRRNGGKENYDPEKAQQASDHRYNVARHARSDSLKLLAKSTSYANPFQHLKDRIENLEMQLEILTDNIRELLNDKQNK